MVISNHTILSKIKMKNLKSALVLENVREPIALFWIHKNTKYVEVKTSASLED